jgi:hypothetical protein
LPSSAAGPVIPNFLNLSWIQSLPFRPVCSSYSSTDNGFSAWGVTLKPCLSDGYKDPHSQLRYTRGSYVRETHISIKRSTVIDHSIIPNRYIPTLPPPPNRSIRLLSKTIFQKRQGRIPFCLRYTNKSRDESRVNKDGFEACDWVDSYDGVNGFDRFSEGNAGDGGTGRSLVEARVDC